jgi:hypothetical protein
MNRVLNAAYALGDEGKKVFFCRLDNKAPTCPNGLDDACSDRDAILDLWHRHPGPLIGVRTGVDFSVIDIDAKHPEARQWWLEHRDRLLPTRTHRTRSGGLHLLYRHREGLRNSASKVTRGVDERGERGYIIWWPAAGFPVLCDGSLAPWPDWLHPRVREVVRAAGSISSRALASFRGTGNHRARIDGVIRRIVNSKEGDRNNLIFWAGGVFAELVRDGAMFDREALVLLVRAAARAGIDQEEAEKAARKCMEGGNAHAS